MDKEIEEIREKFVLVKQINRVEIGKLLTRLEELEVDKSTYVKKWTTALDRAEKAEADIAKLREAVEKHKATSRKDAALRAIDNIDYDLYVRDITLYKVLDETK